MIDDESTDPVGSADGGGEQVEVIPVRDDLFGARKAIREFYSSGAARAAAEAEKVSRTALPQANAARRIIEQAEENRVQMDRIMEGLTAQKRHQEERADKQADATVAIAESHAAVLDLQAQVLDVLRRQSDATLAIAANQQSTLNRIAEVMQEQRDSAPRGLFFYIAVGLATALAGFAALVPLSVTDRWIVAAATVGLAAATGLVVWLIRLRQNRIDSRR